MEGVALNMRAPYFYRTKTQFNKRDIKTLKELKKRLSEVDQTIDFKIFGPRYMVKAEEYWNVEKGIRR
jgi:hypothetical protein